MYCGFDKYKMIETTKGNAIKIKADSLASEEKILTFPLSFSLSLIVEEIDFKISDKFPPESF